MKRFRVLQNYNVTGGARLWLCPWLRDGWHLEDYFNEWLIVLNHQLLFDPNSEYFVDIAFHMRGDYDVLTRDVYLLPAQSGELLNWVKIPCDYIVSIKRPTAEDYRALKTHHRPDLSWVISKYSV